MKMLLRSKHQIPYGSHFKLNLPEKGIVGLGSDFDALYRSCVTWRKANGWAIGLNFENELEAEVCAKHPHECVMDTSNLPKPKGVIDSSTIARGSATMFEVLKARLKGDLQLVSQDEANARAATCDKCPWKVTMRYGCGGPCGAIVDIITATASKETNPPMGSYACGICQCFLRAAVWLDLDVQCSSLEQAIKDEFKQVQTEYPCWKKC